MTPAIDGKTPALDKITVLETPKVSLWYHPHSKIVHHKIKQFIAGDDFKNVLLAGTDLIRKHGGQKWLSDDTDCPVLRPEDLDWGYKHWFPQTALLGWKYWAIVQPAKAVGRASVQGVANKFAKYGVTSQYFADADEALRWLESV